MSVESNQNPLVHLTQAVPEGWIKLVQNRAVGAIRHLVGAKMPAILAESQAHKDEREGRSAFHKGLVEAAVEKAKKDPELVERMFDRLVEEEFGKQENREAVATLAIEHLSDDGAPANDTTPDVDSDWLNTFTRHAETATSEKLRDMWARVLSGEIRQPGSICLRTMQFVSTMDSETVAAAQSLLPWLINKRYTPKLLNKHVPLESLQLARDEGLIGALAGEINNTMTFTGGTIALTTAGHALFLDGIAGQSFTYSCISSSRVLREIASVIPYEPTSTPALAFAEALKSQASITRIRVGRSMENGTTTTLTSVILDWQRPTIVTPQFPA